MYQTVAIQLGLHFKIEKNKLTGSEHFLKMKLTKCARDCSESLICA